MVHQLPSVVLKLKENPFTGMDRMINKTTEKIVLPLLGDLSFLGVFPPLLVKIKKACIVLDIPTIPPNKHNAKSSKRKNTILLKLFYASIDFHI